jgi:hypothetical protein
VGTGIFVSIATGATPLSKREWRLANAMTSAALGRIAENGGPRCCKRCTRLAIAVAVERANAELDVSLEQTSYDLCGLSDTNRECTRSDCVFYREKGV